MISETPPGFLHCGSSYATGQGPSVDAVSASRHVNPKQMLSDQGHDHSSGQDWWSKDPAGLHLSPGSPMFLIREGGCDVV